MASGARDAATLDAEAAHLRSQAGALHAARARATQAHDTEWGTKRDDAARDADASRHAAEHANAQAAQHRESARGYEQTARALEVTANEEVAAGNHARASELREDAQRERALAVSSDERAARAHQAAADQSARADQLDQTVRELDQRFTGEGDERTPAIERVADQLDDKAELLAQAADQQRAALRFQSEGNAEGAARASQSAAATLARADAIQPSFADVSPAVLTGAGTDWSPASAADTSERDTVDHDDFGPDDLGLDSQAGAAQAGDIVDATDPGEPFTGEPDSEPAALDGDGTLEPFAASSAGASEPDLPAFDDGAASTSGFDGHDVSDFAPMDDEPVDVGATSDQTFEFES